MSTIRSPLRDLLELSMSRTPSAWEDRFSHWERPASPTEELEIEKTAKKVREALAADPWFANEGVEIRPQGSYHNNTNVRLEADMDLCAWHQGISVLAEASVMGELAEIDRELGLSPTGRSRPAIAAAIRSRVVLATVAAFDARNVDASGTKAVTISNIPGSRAPADVVPALKTLYVRRSKGLLEFTGGKYFAREGVVIYGTDGSQTINFPALHYQNGVWKRSATSHRFKKMVRIFKKLRDELVVLGTLKQGEVPSFFIESLVWGVENPHFEADGSRYERAKRLLLRMDAQLADPLHVAAATEINGVKPLYDSTAPWFQKWTPALAQKFVVAAWKRLTD